MELSGLKKQIPYQWRVQEFSKYKPEATCVAYIDARDVMDLLDEVCSANNWQSDFKEVAGQIYGGLGVCVENQWIWKWDTGSESNVEKEKGLASDAFKRAAVKWGIGRFLYDLPIKRVKANAIKTDTVKPFVVDDTGQRVYDITKHINGTKNAPAATTAPTKAPVAVKPVPPKIVEDKVKMQKAIIRKMCDAKALNPLVDAADYKRYVLENTGVELIDANLSEIITRLEPQQ